MKKMNLKPTSSDAMKNLLRVGAYLDVLDLSGAETASVTVLEEGRASLFAKGGALVGTYDYDTLVQKLTERRRVVRRDCRG